MSATISGTTLSVSAQLAPGTATLWPLSKKLDVMRRICTHLEGMTRPEYEFDMTPFARDGKLTPRVYRGRTVFGESDPVPLLSVLEGPVPDQEPSRAGMNEIAREDDWVLFVQGWTNAPEDHPTDPCYQFMACVEKRLSEIISTRRSGLPVNPAAYMLENTISGLMIGPGVVRPPQDQVSKWAFFYLPVVVRLPVDASQPFVTA